LPYPSPDRYLDPGYYIDSYNARHRNGGVLRKWYSLLSKGGTHYGKTVQGLGIETATDIAYTTFNWWLWSSIHFPDMASQMVHAVIADWGRCSQAHKQVVNALSAVNLNVPLYLQPHCIDRLELDGSTVLGSELSSPAVWRARLGEVNIEDEIGSFNWNIPVGWDAVAFGDELILYNTTDTSTVPLSVSYVLKDKIIYSDTIYVHFSNEIWVPTIYPEATQSDLEIGISKLTKVDLFPNPASSSVTVNIVGSFDNPIKFELYDYSGRMVRTFMINAPITTIDVSEFPDGVYIMKANSGNETFTQKLVIKK
jgi:hypothetical protein